MPTGRSKVLGNALRSILCSSLPHETRSRERKGIPGTSNFPFEAHAVSQAPTRSAGLPGKFLDSRGICIQKGLDVQKDLLCINLSLLEGGRRAGLH